MNQPAIDSADEQNLIVRSRTGAHYRIPMSSLADFSMPEDTMVIRWSPGKYLVIPPDAVENYRMTDEELLPLALKLKARQRGRRTSRRRR